MESTSLLVCCAEVDARRHRNSSRERPNGAAPESNRPSVELPHRTGFEDLLGQRAPPAAVSNGSIDLGGSRATFRATVKSGRCGTRSLSAKCCQDRRPASRASPPAYKGFRDPCRWWHVLASTEKGALVV